MKTKSEFVDNWFVKLVARRRNEPAVSWTIYYNVDFKADLLSRYMWLFDRYAALVTIAHPELFVEKIVGNIAFYDKEEYCNKIRKSKLSAAKSRVTRIEREGFVPDLFGYNEGSFRKKLEDAKKVLQMWEGDGWRMNIDLPVRYLNRIKEFKTDN